MECSRLTSSLERMTAALSSTRSNETCLRFVILQRQGLDGLMEFIFPGGTDLKAFGTLPTSDSCLKAPCVSLCAKLPNTSCLWSWLLVDRLGGCVLKRSASYLRQLPDDRPRIGSRAEGVARHPLVRAHGSVCVPQTTWNVTLRVRAIPSVGGYLHSSSLNLVGRLDGADVDVTNDAPPVGEKQD